MVERIINQNILPFNLLGLFIYPLVFIIVLIVGYVNIFRRLLKPKEPLKKQKKVKIKKNINWKDKIKKFIEDANDLMNKLNKAIFKKEIKK